MLTVSVKWQKKVFEGIEIDPTLPPYVFKAQLYDLTGVPPERQKIMVKGGLLKDDADWSAIGVKDGQKLMMMGTADEIVKALEKAIVFAEDLPEEEQATHLGYSAGLVNLGNTCYMNSTVQCLKSVPELKSALSKSVDLYYNLKMSRFRDRTDDFKDSVRKSAVSNGYNEAKIASTMASFIIHKPKERSPFTKAAFKTLESIKELDQFMLKHRKDYVDMHRTTEHEKDSIEQEITAFIKACKEQIDILKNSIRNEESNSKGWLGLAADNLNADTIAHKHGVVLILSEKLHSVTAQFDQLRATRFQDIINRAMPRRKPKRIPKESSPVNATLANPEPIEPAEIQAQPRRIQQQQLLDDETQALQVELSNLLDGARQTETKMVEMSALNHLMATHVLQQAQQIEVLYDQAVEATKNVELGNKELSQAIQRNSSSRTFLLLFFFVLTFSVLFLDWYS